MANRLIDRAIDDASASEPQLPTPPPSAVRERWLIAAVSSFCGCLATVLIVLLFSSTEWGRDEGVALADSPAIAAKAEDVDGPAATRPEDIEDPPPAADARHGEEAGDKAPTTDGVEPPAAQLAAAQLPAAQPPAAEKLVRDEADAAPPDVQQPNAEANWEDALAGKTVEPIPEEDRVPWQNFPGPPAFGGFGVLPGEGGRLLQRVDPQAMLPGQMFPGQIFPGQMFPPGVGGGFGGPMGPGVMPPVDPQFSVQIDVSGVRSIDPRKLMGQLPDRLRQGQISIRRFNDQMQIQIGRYAGKLAELEAVFPDLKFESVDEEKRRITATERTDSRQFNDDRKFVDPI